MIRHSGQFIGWRTGLTTTVHWSESSSRSPPFRGAAAFGQMAAGVEDSRARATKTKGGPQGPPFGQLASSELELPGAVRPTTTLARVITGPAGRTGSRSADRVDRAGGRPRRDAHDVLVRARRVSRQQVGVVQ